MKPSTWIVFVGLIIAAVVVGGIILQGPGGPPKVPDLIVSDVEVDCSSGSPNVSATITNKGLAAIDVGKGVEEQLVTMYPASTLPTGTDCACPEGRCSWSSPDSCWVQPYNTPAAVTLKHNDSFNIKLGPPPHIPSGSNQYDLKVEVDPKNGFLEGNENNNANQTIIKPCV